MGGMSGKQKPRPLAYKRWKKISVTEDCKNNFRVKLPRTPKLKPNNQELVGPALSGIGRDSQLACLLLRKLTNIKPVSPHVLLTQRT